MGQEGPRAPLPGGEIGMDGVTMDLITAATRAAGLHPLGSCSVEPGEQLPLMADGRRPVSIVLVGQIGSSLWPAFSASPEYREARPDPLDRWSRRIGDEVAQRLGGVAIYPFDGPPYWPFQAWAQRCGETSVSPLALLIHPRYGLWHAYRFALGFAQAVKLRDAGLQPESPCLNCHSQPCLEACPVGAFGSQGFRFDACVGHVGDPSGGCLTSGCLARRACPVGIRFTYNDEQQRFHMRAFAASRPHA